MRILLTAFEPYDTWETNSSWDTLVELLRVRGSVPDVVTRRYPVDLHRMQEKLYQDLDRGFEGVLHLGQAPGIDRVQLEAICLNVAGMIGHVGDEFGPLMEDAPVAFRTSLPLGSWSNMLKRSGIPACVSFHAGTYLCNAIMYLSHHWFAKRHLRANIGFVHLPLAPNQTSGNHSLLPSMPLPQMAKAVGLLVDHFRGTQWELPFDQA